MGEAAFKMEQAVREVGNCDKGVIQIVNFTEVSFLLARMDRILGTIYQINFLRSDSCTTPHP